VAIASRGTRERWCRFSSHVRPQGCPTSQHGAGVVQPPRESAVGTCLNAAARTLRAEGAVQGDILSVWQVLHRTPSAPPSPAQRVARSDDHCTRNCLLNNRLRQRYSRSNVWISLTRFAQFITATRGRKVDCLASCTDQTCCSISSIQNYGNPK